MFVWIMLYLQYSKFMTVNLLFTSYISGNSVELCNINPKYFQDLWILNKSTWWSSLTPSVLTTLTPRPSKVTEKLFFFPSFTFFSLSSHPAIPSLVQPILTHPPFTLKQSPHHHHHNSFLFLLSLLLISLILTSCQCTLATDEGSAASQVDRKITAEMLPTGEELVTSRFCSTIQLQGMTNECTLWLHKTLNLLAGELKW